MPKFKRILKKKGFTIVELVIVIAVISILAAVTIPAFSSIVRKAQISAASQLSANFNKAVVGYGAVNAPITLMHDAVTAVEDYGFKQNDLVDDDGRYYVVWDSEIKRFVVLDAEEGTVCGEEGNTTPLTKLWKVVDEIPSEQMTSIYLADEFDDKTVSVTVGIDVGDNESVEVIIYTDTDEQVKDIIIRVNDPQTIVNLDNKGNDNVTVIGLNKDTDAETPPPTEPGTPDTPGAPENTDTPKPPDEPVEEETEDSDVFDSSKIEALPGKVVYSVDKNEQYDTLKQGMLEGGELILLADVKECKLYVRTNVVLDLNGFTIAYYDSDTYEDANNTIIIDGGNLLIKDSSTQKLGAIRNKAVTASTSPISAVHIQNSGVLMLESGTISGTKCAIYCEEGTSAIINGGVVIGAGTEGMGINVLSNVSIEINGGYITTDSAVRYAIIARANRKGYSIVLNGGKIDRNIANMGTGELIRNGGELSGEIKTQ